MPKKEIPSFPFVAPVAIVPTASNPASAFIDESFFRSVGLIKELNVIDGSSQHTQQCSDWYGHDFITKWRQTKTRVCQPDPNPAHPFPSQIDCYTKKRMVISHDNYDAGWPWQRFCEVQNAAIRVYPPYYVESTDITMRTGHGEAKMEPHMTSVNCEPTDAIKHISTVCPFILYRYFMLFFHLVTCLFVCAFARLYVCLFNVFFGLFIPFFFFPYSFFLLNFQVHSFSHTHI
jgi:hypothetical protein